MPFREKTITEKITGHLSSYLDFTTPKPYVTIVILGGGIFVYKNRDKFSYKNMESTLALGIESFKSFGEQTKRAYDMISSYTNYLTKSLDEYKAQELKNTERSNKYQENLSQENKFLTEKISSITTANAINTERLGKCRNDLGITGTQVQNLQRYYYEHVHSLEGNSLNGPSETTGADPGILKALEDLYTAALPVEVIPKKK